VGLVQRVIEVSGIPTVALSMIPDLTRALATAAAPDTYVELTFEWPESPAEARNACRDLPEPPIVVLLKKKPWLLERLYSGRVPDAKVAG